MQGQYIHRSAEDQVIELLNEFPAVALLGPRQSGKSTLARHIIESRADCVALDLELPSDKRKLSDPELYFNLHHDKLICLDEIQRFPNLFQVMRSKIDQNKRNGQFLILGSASRDLIRQSSETLAGRLAYIELTPFQASELSEDKSQRKNFLDSLWLRGGFPRSYLADTDEMSARWRDQFIRTFLERDIPQLGFNIPAETIRRLWQMCAHNHGHLLNTSKIGASLGYSHTTIRKHIDLLSQTFMIRLLLPIISNVKKRLVKTPKLYVRDSGILHTLMEIGTQDHLYGHPIFGHSWEGFAVETILTQKPDWHHGFYRTSAGAELDLVIEHGEKRIGFEFKASTSPQVSRGFWNAIDDLKPDHVYIVAPVNESYPLDKAVTVININDLLKRI